MYKYNNLHIFVITR